MAVPSPLPTLDKAGLRQAMRAARKAFVATLDPTERVAMERALHAQLRPLIEQANIVGAYLPIGSEIDPLGAAFAPDKIAFPAFSQSDERFRFRIGPPVATGPHGIPQPGPMEPEVDPDLVLVPLLAVDPIGHRLGQGGGHYDRALAPLRARGTQLIGIGWPLQRLEFSLPIDEWDVPLSGFASPSGLEMFR